MTEAWIAPPSVRELRDLVRYRAKLVQLRTGLKAQLHAVVAKNGVLPTRWDMFGPGGSAQLDALELPAAYTERIDSLRRLVEILDGEVERFNRQIHSQLKDDPGYRAIQVIEGVGPVIAAVFVAEIGDVQRFKSPPALCSWAGLTPKHRESDIKVTRGKITKQGSRIVRWAAIEAISKQRGGAKLRRLPRPDRPARETQSPRGRRSQAVDLRVLGTTRPPHPLPRTSRMTRAAPDQMRARYRHGVPAGHAEKVLEPI